MLSRLSGDPWPGAESVRALTAGQADQAFAARQSHIQGDMLERRA